MIKRGDLVIPRDNPPVPLDLVSHTDGMWIPFGQGDVGVILEVFQHINSISWVTVLSPSGIGDCYAHDLKVVK